ncbi:hypothetical protein Tco_1110823 [Tanacetum coccineum]|uniref:Uncharacterized protein n=1 Tax=Tanacetum coccineum TaxID=301880 RepID=A0ABQ5ILD2_9ASTR
MQKGFSASYDKWTSHRVCSDDDEYVSSDDEEGGEGYDNMNDADDDFDEMFDNIGQSKWGNNWKTSGESSSTRDKDLESLRRLLDDSNQDLYKGCKNYSKKALPTPSFVPKNYYEAKTRTYVTWGLRCREPRFKGKDNNVPRKVLHYFPLIPRLQRLFIDPQVACDMRWHKEKELTMITYLDIPPDALKLKHLDKVDPPFANDPRSVRLGLATDGFNSFSNLSSLHSTWPVFLVLYNLPPWKCMKDPFLLMSMLIPGPTSPGDNIDGMENPSHKKLNNVEGKDNIREWRTQVIKSRSTCQGKRRDLILPRWRWVGLEKERLLGMIIKRSRVASQAVASQSVACHRNLLMQDEEFMLKIKEFYHYSSLLPLRVVVDREQTRNQEEQYLNEHYHEYETRNSFSPPQSHGRRVRIDTNEAYQQEQQHEGDSIQTETCMSDDEDEEENIGSTSHEYETMEEAMTHPPKGIEVSDWVLLCERFASEDFQKISEKNKKNRSKNLVPPTVGTRSLARRVDEPGEKEKKSEIEQIHNGTLLKKVKGMNNEEADTSW